MSLVYKCDRCSSVFDRVPGKMYLDNERYKIAKIRTDCMIDQTVHLCPECHKSLNEWFKSKIPTHHIVYEKPCDCPCAYIEDIQKAARKSKRGLFG
jgi:hypothetical protein